MTQVIATLSVFFTLSLSLVQAQECISVTQAAQLVRHFVYQQDAQRNALPDPYDFYFEQEEFFSCSKTDLYNNIRRSRQATGFTSSAFCFARTSTAILYASLNLAISCGGQVHIDFYRE